MNPIEIVKNNYIALLYWIFKGGTINEALTFAGIDKTNWKQLSKEEKVALAKQICAERQQHKYSIHMLSELFGVSRGTIQNILNRKEHYGR